MLQIKNSTPFSPALALLPNEEGIDTLYIMVKASFSLWPQITLAEQQVPPIPEDVYWGDPTTSSLRYASEMHLGKRGSDICLNGHAYAPEGKLVSTTGVLLSVGRYQQLIAVMGDRQWYKGRITAPLPFDKMALTYENAYGGQQKITRENNQGDKEESFYGEMRNPVGKGFIGKRKIADIDGLALPNLEDPQQLITQPFDEPTPLCYSFIAPNWSARIPYAGSYDKHWQKNRAPYLPSDFDRQFFNMAHPRFIARPALVGGEPVRIVNASPHGELRFNLPTMKLSAKVKFHDRVELAHFELETVFFEPDINRMMISWRSAVPCDKEALRITQVEIDWQE